MGMEVKVALQIACQLGEGPVWDERRQLICWIDILKGEIHQFDPIAKQLSTLAVESLIGTLVLCTSGHFIAAVQEGLVKVEPVSGQKNTISHSEITNSAIRFNDGKCAPDGKLWIGTVALDETPQAGSLYTIDQDFRIELKLPRINLSNGMAWSPDQQKFYYIDTPTRKVMAYTYDRENTRISVPRLACTIEPEDGYPDGMTIDEEGMLWIAHWGGWQVCRWNPHTGAKLLSIKLPVAHVSSVSFGGKNGNDLYITTARKDLSEQELEKQPLAGSLFVVENSGFKGLPAFRFPDE